MNLIVDSWFTAQTTSKIYCFFMYIAPCQHSTHSEAGIIMNIPWTDIPMTSPARCCLTFWMQSGIRASWKLWSRRSFLESVSWSICFSNVALFIFHPEERGTLHGCSMQKSNDFPPRGRSSSVSFFSPQREMSGHHSCLLCLAVIFAQLRVRSCPREHASALRRSAEDQGSNGGVTHLRTYPSLSADQLWCNTCACLRSGSLILCIWSETTKDAEHR